MYKLVHDTCWYHGTVVPTVLRYEVYRYHGTVLKNLNPTVREQILRGLCSAKWATVRAGTAVSTS